MGQVPTGGCTEYMKHTPARSHPCNFKGLPSDKINVTMPSYDVMEQKDGNFTAILHNHQNWRCRRPGNEAREDPVNIIKQGTYMYIDIK